MKDYIKNLYFFLVGCTVPTFFHYQNDIATYSMKAIEDVTTYACGDATSSTISSSSGRVELLQLPWGNNMKLATTRLGMATTAGSEASSSGSPEHQKQDHHRNQQLFLDPCGVIEICRISFGLYGTNPKYLQGMIRNIELQPQVFPGWVVRVYHDDSVTQEWLGKLQEAATQSQTTVEFISMSQSQIKGTIAGMFWRFLVADDGNVDRYIIRDSDSRLNLREKHAINEWIMSGKSAHNMRDHPSHANYIISGGMWGGTKNMFPTNTSMETLIQNFKSRDGYVQDMIFLQEQVYPLIRGDIIEHDSYGCVKYKQEAATTLTSSTSATDTTTNIIVPFPTRRSLNMEHVGQVFESTNDTPRQGDIDLLAKQKSPLECRKYPTWEYG